MPGVRSATKIKLKVMNETVYATPSSNLNTADKILKGKKIAILGSILQIPLFIGTIATIVGFIVTFQAVTIYGAGDPKLMAGGISSALVSLILGSLVSLPGYIVTLYVVVKTSYREKWFIIFNILAAIFWLLFVPIGTVLGIVYITLLILKCKSKGEA